MRLLVPVFSSRFKRDLAKIEKQGKDSTKVKAAISILVAGGPLPPKYKDHSLIGDWKGCRECHIEPDWLMIYEFLEAEEVFLHRTGSHAELFGK